MRARRGRVLAGGLTAAAITGSALLGSMPTLQNTQVTLTDSAHAYYLRGTNIGRIPSDAAYAAFADGVIDATVGPHLPAQKVDYPGAFWPVSTGYLSDPTYDASVQIGLAALHDTVDGQTGAIIYGYSQGAVVATMYKRETGAAGNTYVLVANPNRPNGGILQRFNGLTIPILNISFNGATPTDGDLTYDIGARYDGWVDFPKYPLNLLATANALLGIVYLHGKYDLNVDPAVLNDPAKTDVSQHGNTIYYLIHTDRLPLLMPLQGLLPDSLLDKMDKPLRQLVELGYDRTDYGEPTTAGLINPVNPVQVVKDLVDATGIRGDSAGGSSDGQSAPAALAASADTRVPEQKPSTPHAGPPGTDRPRLRDRVFDGAVRKFAGRAESTAADTGPTPNDSLRDRWSARTSASPTARSDASPRSGRFGVAHTQTKRSNRVSRPDSD